MYAAYATYSFLKARDMLRGTPIDKLDRLLGSGTAVFVPEKPSTPLEEITYYDGHKVKVHTFALDPKNNPTANWWGSVAHGWERDTLAMIRVILEQRPNTVAIDFGSWIGPTAMFSAPYAKHVYAMEPDPRAYSNVYWNVQANPHIKEKITVQNLCIAGAAGELEMRGRAGDSQSSLLKNAVNPKDQTQEVTTWKVKCVTFDQFLAQEGVKWEDIGIIKMDTEGELGRLGGAFTIDVVCSRCRRRSTNLTANGTVHSQVPAHHIAVAARVCVPGRGRQAGGDKQEATRAAHDVQKPHVALRRAHR
jgi:FkbM family methyltransferase